MRMLRTRRNPVVDARARGRQKRRPEIGNSVASAAMPRSIDYYFTSSSPWTFIGHDLFMEIAKRHALKVNYKPVSFAKVFSETGGLPLPQRPLVRQRYRLVELQRWRDRRGLTFNIRPRHTPFDVTLLDRTVIAIVNRDADPDRFMRAAFEAIWEEERNLGEVENIAALLTECGLDAPQILEEAAGPSTESVYLLNLENALAADVFGAPSYVLAGEVFWGQDRLELLDDALSSGRAAYTSG
jgi:2-hydroxychromene-2-carboxylate isomerase